MTAQIGGSLLQTIHIGHIKTDMDNTGVAPETILIDFSGLSIHKLYQLDIYMAKQPAESSFILLRFSEKNPAELVRRLQNLVDAGFIIYHLIKFKSLLILL